MEDALRMRVSAKRGESPLPPESVPSRTRRLVMGRAARWRMVGIGVVVAVILLSVIAWVALRKKSPQEINLSLADLPGWNVPQLNQAPYLCPQVPLPPPPDESTSSSNRSFERSVGGRASLGSSVQMFGTEEMATAELRDLAQTFRSCTTIEEPANPAFGSASFYVEAAASSVGILTFQKGVFVVIMYFVSSDGSFTKDDLVPLARLVESRI